MLTLPVYRATDHRWSDRMTMNYSKWFASRRHLQVIARCQSPHYTRGRAVGRVTTGESILIHRPNGPLRPAVCDNLPRRRTTFPTFNPATDASSSLFTHAPLQSRPPIWEINQFIFRQDANTSSLRHTVSPVVLLAASCLSCGIGLINIWDSCWVQRNFNIPYRLQFTFQRRNANDRMINCFA